MAKLKIGRRLKNAFRKQNSGGGDEQLSDSASVSPVTGQSIKSVASTGSNASSLNSDVRFHGPIDIDTCRKHKGKNKKSRRRNSRMNKKGDSLGQRERVSLPKIIESRSSTPSSSNAGGGNSRSSTPVTHQTDGSHTSQRSSVAPRSPSSPQQQLVTQYGAFSSEHSPGAQSVSTVNGRDVFERSRSAMSYIKRNRSSTPNSTSTATMLEDAEHELSGTSPCSPLAENDRYNIEDDIDAYAATTTSSSSRGRSPQSSCKQVQLHIIPKSSPTSVISMFRSAYPVEIDASISISASGSIDDGTDKYCSKPQEQLPLNYSQQSRTVSPPKINRLSPTRMFGDTSISSLFKQTANWDPLNYTNLEDAVEAHAAMLTTGDTTGDHQVKNKESDGVIAIKKTTDASAAASVSSRGTTGTSSTKDKAWKKDAEKKFLALKKDAEKNEFKKVVLLNKKGSAVPLPPPQDVLTKITKIPIGEPQEMIEIQANNLDAILKKKKNTQIGIQGNDKYDVPVLDPPGVDATNTRSASLVVVAPSSPNPFFEDLGGTGTATSSSQQQPLQPTATSLQLLTADAATTANVDVIVGDVIQSFSFDNQDNLDSLSDDSCSYLSELESIGEITICDETARLLDAHKSYVEDAKTNLDHPSRRKKSVMKVGSQFKNGSIWNTADDPSILTEQVGVGSADVTIETEQRHKLTWYDDEENWNKPFTLRTDESFDASTVTSDNKGMGMGVVGGVERIVRYKVVDQFLDDFIKGLGKYTACGGGDIDDVASFDQSGEGEI